MTHSVPELLAPAGSLEKLKMAINYGANAVYLGGQKYGLRSAADNFTSWELKEATSFAHSKGALVYVVLNSFLHDSDFEGIEAFLSELAEFNVDAVIVSDLGMVSLISSISDIPIHLSTQASCISSYGAEFWKKMGITRVILGREATIEEGRLIKEKTGLEVEMFIHGSMCMSYSGHCVISNYTQGRDSNRGGCAHSCRFEYSLTDEKNNTVNSITFMSSKDLEGVALIPEFAKAGIDSIKVEGRMKSIHYAGAVPKVYSQALSEYKNKNEIDANFIKWASEQLNKVSHRAYHSGNLSEKADEKSIFSERESEDSDYVIVGQILDFAKDKSIALQVRTGFKPGDKLELVRFSKRDDIEFVVNKITNLKDEHLEKANPGRVVLIPWIDGVERSNLIRMRKEQ